MFLTKWRGSRWAAGNSSDKLRPFSKVQAEPVTHASHSAEQGEVVKPHASPTKAPAANGAA